MKKIDIELLINLIEDDLEKIDEIYDDFENDFDDEEYIKLSGDIFEKLINNLGINQSIVSPESLNSRITEIRDENTKPIKNECLGDFLIASLIDRIRINEKFNQVYFFYINRLVSFLNNYKHLIRKKDDENQVLQVYFNLIQRIIVEISDTVSEDKNITSIKKPDLPYRLLILNELGLIEALQKNIKVLITLNNLKF